MRYSDEKLELIFDRTSGNCHICCGKLAFCNYGIRGSRGAWNVEHSKPQALGGTDHLNNLFAAHIGCNEAKRIGTTRRARAANGRTRAPYSVSKRQQKRRENAVRGGIVAGMAGGAMLGAPGIILGGLLGVIDGFDQNPDW